MKRSLQIKIECQLKKYTNHIQVQNLKRFTRWVLQEEGYYEGNIGIIFASKSYIRRMNLRFFNRSELTDVISFPLHEMDSVIPEGEIYISVEQARYQAFEYRVPLNTEIQRLIIHGVLHVLGYEDKISMQRKKMTSREDQYIALFGDTNIYM